jgi:hypothetical protein
MVLRIIWESIAGIHPPVTGKSDSALLLHHPASAPPKEYHRPFPLLHPVSFPVQKYPRG